MCTRAWRARAPPWRRGCAPRPSATLCWARSGPALLANCPEGNAEPLRACSAGLAGGGLPRGGLSEGLHPRSARSPRQAGAFRTFLCQGRVT